MDPLIFAITGANGQVGAFLTEYLRNCGHIVYELVRSSEKAKDKTYYKFFDLAEPQKISSLQGIDVLIHAAYFFDTTVKKYESTNVAGSQQLFRQAKIDRVKYAIFISTLSAHPDARSLYGRTKYQLEQLLMRENLNMSIIRPGLIFHSPLKGITSAMDNFVGKFPVVPLIGRGKQKLYPCLLEDLVQLIFTLSMKQSVIKRPIAAATECAITFKQLVQYLAIKRQKHVLAFPIPFYAIYFMLKTIEFFVLPIGLRSDSLLGLQYADSAIDFSETENLGVHFRELTFF